MNDKHLAANLSGPWLFAHRGYSKLAPENTLAAFQLARERGIPGIELDVRLCATGEMVVFHDDSLKRICGVEKTVEELSLGALRELDAGIWKDPSFKGEPVPLLSEVFETLGPEMILDIEIKSSSGNAAPQAAVLAELIQRHGMEKRCLVSSFNPLAVKSFRKVLPGIPTAVIYCHSSGVPWYLRRGEGRLISGCALLKPDHKQVSSLFMAYHGRLEGYQVLPWTVDDPAVAERLLKAGVRGIISNDPGPMKPLFGLTE